MVAAAVMLPPGHDLAVRDSKTLSEKQREALFAQIEAVALGVGLGIVDAEEIDAIGIRPATLLAMRKAIEQLEHAEHLLIDAHTVQGIDIAQTGIVRGDQKEHCIAAASIVAKVSRDRLMVAAHALHPVYGFATHKGYGTKAHRKHVAAHGRSPLHRKSFTIRV